METVNVIAISKKKEKGWIKVAPITGNGVWSDIGMHFEREKFDSVFTEPGLYALTYRNTASLGATALEVEKAEKILLFSEYAS